MHTLIVDDHNAHKCRPLQVISRSFRRKEADLGGFQMGGSKGLLMWFCYDSSVIKAS